MKEKVSKAIGSIVVIILLGGGGFWLYKNFTSENLSITRVTAEQLTKTIEVPGIVKAGNNIELAFETTGRVKNVAVNTGQEVKENDVLVELERDDLEAQLRKAEGGLQSAIAKQQQTIAALERARLELGELNDGPRSQEIDIAITKLETSQEKEIEAQKNLNSIKAQGEKEIAKAQTAYNNAVKNEETIILEQNLETDQTYDLIPEVVTDALQEIEDILLREVDALFSYTESNSTLSFVTTNTQAKSNAENEHLRLRQTFPATKSSILQSITTSNTLTQENKLMQTEQLLTETANWLNELTKAVNNIGSATAATAAEYKLAVSTARSSTTTQLNTIKDLERDIETQKISEDTTLLSARTQTENALASLEVTKETVEANTTRAQTDLINAQASTRIAQKELDLLLAGSTSNQIAQQQKRIDELVAQRSADEGVILQNEATIDEITAAIEKKILRAPFDGIVTKMDVDKGEIVTSQRTVTELTSINMFEIETYISEIDINLVKIGDRSEITLDALGEELIFTARVEKIELGATDQNGVPTYKTTLSIQSAVPEIVRDGLTANVKIYSSKETKVLTIPLEALFDEKGITVLKRLVNGEEELVSIRILDQTDSGRIVIEGTIQEGQEILVNEK